MTERLAFGYGVSSADAPSVGSAQGGSPQGPADPPPPEAAIPRKERRDWAFIGLMAFTGALFLRPQDIFPPLRMLHLAELTAIFALGALVWGRLSRGLPVSRIVPELLGVAALAMVILGLAPFSIWPGGTINTFTELFAKVVLIFLLMVNTLTTPRRVDQFTTLIVVAMTYIAFWAAIDYVRGVNLIENGRVTGTVGGIFENPNDLAANLVAVLPLAISLALRPGTTLRRGFGAAAILFMVWAIIATLSRSGTVGLAVMILFLLLKLLPRRPGLVFAAVLLGIMATPLLPDSYIRRVYSITNPSLDDTGSREARRILMREAWQTFLEYPFTGVGAGQFKNYNPNWRDNNWRETHNVVLQVAAELGILGVICWGFLLIRGFLAARQTRVLLRRIDRYEREHRVSIVTPEERAGFDAHQIAMGASLAGWFACALFASVAYHWTFYYLLAMAIAPRDILAERLRAVSRTRTRWPAAA